MEIYNNLKEAYENGVLYGCRTITLSQSFVATLKDGNVIAISVNDEYMVFLEVRK